MRVYLDNNATAPLRPEAKTAMLAALDMCGNASSVHAEGRAARAFLDAARKQVAQLAAASADNVIFTSGGTEANALVINGAVQAASEAGQRITRLVVSAVEHDSVLATAARCEQLHAGVKVVVCPVVSSGSLNLAELRRLLMEGKGRALVSLQAVNNETGVIQPVQAAASLARESGALVHCDAVQAAGKIPLGLDLLGVDYLTFSAHKIGGPQGAGAVVKRQGVPLASQIIGGQQEFGYRAGTQNVAAIAGFGAAAAALKSATSAHISSKSLESRLKSLCPEAVILGENADRVGNTTCIAAPNITAETLLIALDLDGFAVSAGAACTSGRITRSHVLAAMGCEPALAACAIRISLGWQTQSSEIQAFADAWGRIVNRARARTAAA